MRLSLANCFAKRLLEEMTDAKLSGNALAKKSGVSQRSVARILLPEGHKDRQIPTLDKIEALAEALGLPAWALLMERDQLEQRVIRPVAPSPGSKVHRLPSYPSIFPKHEKPTKSRRRA